MFNIAKLDCVWYYIKLNKEVQIHLPCLPLAILYGATGFVLWTYKYERTAFGPNSGCNKGLSCYNRTFLPPLALPKIPRAIIKRYILRDKKTRYVISRILGQRAKKRNPFTFKTTLKKREQLCWIQFQPRLPEYAAYFSKAGTLTASIGYG